MDQIKRRDVLKGGGAMLVAGTDAQDQTRRHVADTGQELAYAL